MNTWNVTGFDGVDSSCGLTEDAARSVAQEMANKSGDIWSYYDSSAEDEAIDVEPEEIEVSVVSAGPCTVLPGTPEACDVEVSIKLPTGRTLTGGVTMVPDRINGGYKPFGDEPSLWVAGTMFDELSGAFHGDRLGDVLRAVASEASLAIGRV